MRGLAYLSLFLCTHEHQCAVHASFYRDIFHILALISRRTNKTLAKLALCRESRKELVLITAEMADLRAESEKLAEQHTASRLTIYVYTLCCTANAVMISHGHFKN